MHKMVNSYGMVHNSRYWSEIESSISKYGASKEDVTIMDLGCGPGLLLRDLLHRYHPQRVIGVDLSEVMLEHAEIELEEELLELENSGAIETDGVEIKLIQQHLQHDPHLPTGVDYIFSSRVLRSFEDQHQSFDSMYKALNPGGLLVLLDWTRASIPTYDQWFRSSESHFSDLTAWDVVAYHRNFSRYDLEDWEYILNAAGLEVVHRFQLSPVYSCIIGKKPL